MNIIDAYNKSEDGDIIVLRIEPNDDLEFHVRPDNINSTKLLILNEKTYTLTVALSTLSSSHLLSNDWEIHREQKDQIHTFELRDLTINFIGYTESSEEGLSINAIEAEGFYRGIITIFKEMELIKNENQE